MDNKKGELRWRVIYGYSAHEYVSITEEFLEKAKYAWIAKKVFVAPNGKWIGGGEIKRIEPDFRFYTGWYDSYEPKEGDDFLQIQRDVPMKEIEERSNLADTRVSFIAKSGRYELLGKPEEVDKLLLTA